MEEKDEVLQGRKRLFAWFLQNYLNVVDVETKESLLAQLPRIWASNDSDGRDGLTRAIIAVGKLVAKDGLIDAEDLSTLAEIAKNGKLFLYPSGNWPEPLGQFVVGTLHDVMDGYADWTSMQEYCPNSFRSRLVAARAMIPVDTASAASCPIARLKTTGRRILRAVGIVPVVGHDICSIQP